MADAPSSSTSTRSMALNGMVVRFTPCTPWISPEKLLRRLPFSSTRVRPPPKPRNEAVLAEKVSAPTVFASETLPALLFAATRLSSSYALVAPDLSMSSFVRTTMAAGPSPSTRLMFEPVTSIFSIFWACCAKLVTLPSATTAPPRAADTAIPSEHLFFMVILFSGLDTSGFASRRQELRVKKIQRALGTRDQLTQVPRLARERCRVEGGPAKLREMDRPVRCVPVEPQPHFGLAHAES